MKIYTKTGDAGQTSLFGGQRVAKDHPRLATYGTVDELNAHLGLVRTALLESHGEIGQLLGKLQNELFDLGAELATPQPTENSRSVRPAAIAWLEDSIDTWEAKLPPLKQFILPGGTEAAARLHVARCVCRRAERELATLMHDEPIRHEVMIYLNRLGDLLFVLARTANKQADVPDVPWEKSDG